MKHTATANNLSADIAPASPDSRTSLRRMRACHECDWVVVLPTLRPGEHATCPRCGHILVRRHFRPAQRSMALALSALIALILAISFPFVSFEARGIGNNIELTQTATSMIGFHQPLVAIIVALTIIVLPAVYLCGVIWLQLGLLRAAPFPFSRGIARSLTHLNPWMMADVFIIAALVSLIKIAGMAQIILGVSFWAFCAFAILLLMTTRSIDADWMWFSLAGEPQAPKAIRTGETAASQGLAGCSTNSMTQVMDIVVDVVKLCIYAYHTACNEPGRFWPPPS